MRTTLWLIALILGVTILGVTVAPAPAAPYEEVEVKDGGSVTGRVTFVGTPPAPEVLVVSTDHVACGQEAPSRALLVSANHGVQSAVLNLRDVARGRAWEEREYTLGQTGCRFEPHVLLFRDGADLNIFNHDRIAHGVRSYGRDSVFNVGQPKFVVQLLVEDFTKKLSERKVIRIGCDLHPWMKAWVVVQKHPYFALTDDDGSFRLADVPPGEYELELWHETLGEKARRVVVAPGKETVVTFELGN